MFPASENGEGAAEDRYSIAYFGHPEGDTVLEIVPSERVRIAGLERGEKDGIREEVVGMTADEHLLSRLRATYFGLYRDGDGNGKGA